MAKILFLGDTHFGVSGSSDFYLDMQERFCKQLMKVLKDEQIDYLVHLGDLYDTRKTIDTKMLDRTNQFFVHPLNELHPKTKTFILVGNHDTTFKNTLHPNTPQTLLSWSNLTVISEPTEVQIDKNTSLLLVPWITDENREIAIKAIQTSKANLCAGHFDIIGYEFLKGIKSQQGFASEMFKHFELVYSGHYHGPSHLGNIIYTGTPYQLNWNDANDIKGYHVYDTKTKEDTRHTQLHQQIYLLIDATEPQTLTSPPPETTNKIVKIIADTSTDLYQLQKYQEEVQQKAYRVQTTSRHNYQQQQNSTSNDKRSEQTTKNSLSILEIFNAYIKETFPAEKQQKIWEKVQERYQQEA